MKRIDLAVFLVLAVPALATTTYTLGDATYGTAAIDITFSWSGNVSDSLTNFEWSTPLSSSVIDGTLSGSDVAWWQSLGFPDGIANLGVYLLTDSPVWSEDCTGPAGGVGSAFCGVPGGHMDLNIRDPVVGTYGFEISRSLSLAEVDSVATGTLVNETTDIPEPSFVGFVGLIVLICARRGYSVRFNALLVRFPCARRGIYAPVSAPHSIIQA